MAKRKAGPSRSRGGVGKASGASRRAPPGGAAGTPAPRTGGGPPRRPSGARNAAAAKQAATELVAEAFPFNAAKPSEYAEAAAAPQPGQSV